MGTLVLSISTSIGISVGPIRGIPFFWRCVDASFGVMALYRFGLFLNALIAWPIEIRSVYYEGELPFRTDVSF